MAVADKNKSKTPNVFAVLKPYTTYIIALIILSALSNGLTLIVPKLISGIIDSFGKPGFNLETFIFTFIGVVVGSFVATYIQSLIQTYTSEKAAKDIRHDLSVKISEQSYAYVQNVSPAKLLTNLTSDVDAIKQFITLAVVAIFTSIFMIVGISAVLLSINWRLALSVLIIIPLIATCFYIVFRRIRTYFSKMQEIIDWLNRVIDESILGAALIRVLNSQQYELTKFLDANTSAKNTGLKILRLFSILIPFITFVANMATVIILVLGGYYVTTGSLSLGNLVAFNTYVSMLIFPILMIGFMSNVIASANASYARISQVLSSNGIKPSGTIKSQMRGDIDIKNVTVKYGERFALKNVSFSVKAGSRVAIIGPTGSGKTQLLYLLTGLISPESGSVQYDGHPIQDYDPEILHKQISFVFQDSIIFNMSLRENICFGDASEEKYLDKAIDTSELHDFINNLPAKLDTVVSERGTSLSGGQKQRIMLARALALEPKVLLLDDFTARVDPATEQKILSNIRTNYPELTLVSITQKISSVTDFDLIILLEEGEVLAQGTHEELMKTSPEYVQIFNSQRSTEHL